MLLLLDFCALMSNEWSVEQKKIHKHIYIQPAGMHYIKRISFHVFTIHHLYCYLDAVAAADDVNGGQLAVFSFSLYLFFFIFSKIKKTPMLLLLLYVATKQKYECKTNVQYILYSFVCTSDFTVQHIKIHPTTPVFVITLLSSWVTFYMQFLFAHRSVYLYF